MLDSPHDDRASTAPAPAPVQKKALCQQLCRDLQRSPLAGRIDPKAFLVMLHTKFDYLCADGEFQLDALWPELVAAADVSAATQLVQRFFRSCSAHGLRCKMPDGVAPPAADGADALFADLEIPGHTSPAPSPADASASTIDEEARSKIIERVLNELRAGPAATIADVPRLSFALNASFDDFSDGIHFDLEPLTAWLEARSPDEVMVREAIGRVGLKLREAGLSVEVPSRLQINLDTFAPAIARAERPPAPPPAAPRRTRSIDLPHAGPRPTGRWKIGLAAAIAAVLLGFHVVSGMSATASDEALSSVSPLLERGYIQDNILWGELPATAWNGLSPDERQDAAAQAAKGLKGLKLQTAVLRAGDRTVIQIERGRVVLVGR